MVPLSGCTMREKIFSVIYTVCNVHQPVNYIQIHTAQTQTIERTEMNLVVEVNVMIYKFMNWKGEKSESEHSDRSTYHKFLEWSNGKKAFDWFLCLLCVVATALNSLFDSSRRILFVSAAMNELAVCATQEQKAPSQRIWIWLIQWKINFLEWQ